MYLCFLLMFIWAHVGNAFVVRIGKDVAKMDLPLDMQNHSITGIPLPLGPTDVTNKAYVDANAGGSGVESMISPSYSQFFCNVSSIVTREHVRCDIYARNSVEYPAAWQEYDAGYFEVTVTHSNGGSQSPEVTLDSDERVYTFSFSSTEAGSATVKVEFYKKGVPPVGGTSITINGGDTVSVDGSCNAVLGTCTIYLQDIYGNPAGSVDMGRFSAIGTIGNGTFVIISPSEVEWNEPACGGFTFTIYFDGVAIPGMENVVVTMESCTQWGLVSSSGVSIYNLYTVDFTTYDRVAMTDTYRTSGKWYWEITIDDTVTAAWICVSKTGAQLDGSNPHITNLHHCFRPSTGEYYHNSAYSSGYGSVCADGDTVMVALDMDVGKVWFGKAPSTWWGSPSAGTGEAFSGFLFTGEYHAGILTPTSSGWQGTAHFMTPWISSPPPGFLGLGMHPQE